MVAPLHHLRAVDDTRDEVEALVARSAGRVALGDLLDDLPRRLRRTWAPGRAVHEAWRFDAADQRSLRWWPQGVSTAADAGEAGLGGLPPEARGRRLAVMTSYAKTLPWHRGEHGSRVAFLDLDAGRYRHVLLVRPKADGTLEPLHVHAGGVVWLGEHLHVAATGRGLFTCRLDDVLRVRSATDAFGYRYVLPVRRQYRAAADGGAEGFRYSFCSLDRATDPPTVMVGEYSNDPARTRRLARFPVDDTTGLLETGPDDRTLLEPLGDGPLRMQGAVRARGRLHLSVSEGRLVPGSVWTGTAGDLRHHRWATPMGNEDLACSPAASPADDLLWSVSEHPTARWLFSMRRAWFDR
ncbi:hypothetical protein [Nocardioides litoris]|uniref:hypothetical protein n=1 Tax=Nocardioides litoris TaxID=1926648 RepID=UPI00111DCEF0|nr:hypothetical protein [Nocardioides litoris]